jgi:lactose/L-arabinose transport system substrate-binding protein
MLYPHIIKRLVAAILLSALILTACGGAPPAGEQTQATSVPPAAPATSAAPSVTSAAPPTTTITPAAGATAAPAVSTAAKPTGEITVWGWKAAMDTITMTNVLQDFQTEYPGIKVNIVLYQPADVYQKLPLAISAGTGAPDVSLVENSHLGQLVDLGGLADLTERVQPYLDKMNQYKWNDAMKDGKYYAMPWDSGPVVLYYRRDVFKKAGLPDDPAKVSELVATWDDYLNVCKTIKEKAGVDCFAQNKANNTARLYEMMLWQQGLGYYNDKGEVTVDSPENIAALEKLGEFWQAGLLSDQQEWTDGWYAELASKDHPIATTWMGVFLKTWIASGTAGDWGVARMPAMKAGQVRAANDGGSAFVIPEQSQNQDAAWAFVEFLLGREESQLKMFAFSDFIPSLETTYDAPIFKEADPFFGGQAAREIYADVVKNVPTAYVYGPHYSEMNGFVTTALQKYATGQAAADALKEAAEAIRQQTGSS